MKRAWARQLRNAEVLESLEDQETYGNIWRHGNGFNGLLGLLCMSKSLAFLLLGP